MTTRATVLAFLALAALPAAATAAPWSAPRSVTASGLAREPVVALGGPDAAAVAYIRHVGGADRAELRQGTVSTLHTPVILDRDARHGFDSPALVYSGHSALVVWRRFQVPDTRVLAFSSVSSRGVATDPQVLTGPPNSYEPTFLGPDALTFWRRTAAYVRTIVNGRPGVTTRLPTGAAFESRVALLPDGTRVAVWPNGGAIFAATQAPGAPAFGPVARLSKPGGFARSPQLAVTRDGHAVAVWSQSDGVGRALVAAAAPPGGAFAAPVQLTSGAAQALEVQAVATSAGDVLAAYVSARADNPAGPLQAVRIRPDGSGAGQLTLSAPGERVRDVSLATDSGAAYAAWTTAGTARRSIRVVRISGTVVGTRRTVSGSDNAAAGPPAFAMTLRGRALIAYATKSARIRLVTRAAN